MTWRVGSLGSEQDLTHFDCGNSELNQWLIQHALHAIGQGTRTYVAADDDGRVIGYFAVVPHVVERDDVPRSIGRCAPRQIPAILLAKLALDRAVQGQGLGAELLVLALATILDAARVAGGKLVVVDAVDRAAATFSAHHDFVACPANPSRLVQKLSTIARALGEPWP
ncbi:MAG: GNAT family N-acetyltransferase [Acidimicrobiales bacterium]